MRDHLRGDPLMRRFFEAFLFEDVPATDRRPDALYLDEVEQCDVYVGLFGRDYGSEDAQRVSPIEATGRFVTRIRRAALAGQPVVFTDPDDVRRSMRGRVESQPESGLHSQPESRLESGQLESEPAQLESAQLESRPESLRTRVLGLLGGGPCRRRSCPAGWVRSRRPASSTAWSAGSWPIG